MLQELAGRSNVILVGDSIGDAGMADGVCHDTVLKIGFLNSNVSVKLLICFMLIVTWKLVIVSLYKNILHKDVYISNLQVHYNKMSE